MIPCKNCEGTGKRLNMFDPPKRDMPGIEKRGIIAKSKIQRSPSGREILKENCFECHGTGNRLGFIEIIKPGLVRGGFFCFIL